MIAQQELQDLFKLPVVERLQLAQQLIESALGDASLQMSALPPTNGGTSKTQAPAEESAVPPTKIPFASLAGRYAADWSNGAKGGDESAPSPAAQWLLKMAGRYSGGPGNTATSADEICEAEIDKHVGFTTKH